MAPDPLNGIWPKSNLTRFLSGFNLSLHILLVDSHMKFISFFFVLMVSFLVCKGQYVPEPNQKKDTTIYVSSTNNEKSKSTLRTGFDPAKLIPGGNFALSFGNPYYIDISPSLGYMVTENLLLGLGATYIAAGGRNVNGYKYNFNYYGSRALGRQKVFENFFANAELDFLNVPYFLGTGSETLRKWLISPLVGGSYVMPFGNRGGVQATLLYNLNYQQAFSPFPSALVWRLGFFL